MIVYNTSDAHREIVDLLTQLRETRAAYVIISHDRAFLRALTRATLWIDRGTVRRNERGFEAFEDWRETVWSEEDIARHKLDRKIKAEAKWAVEGISARRKRNQGRVRALQAMRAERAALIRRQGTADMALETGQTSGRLVIEAKGISKRYDDKLILRPFDLTVLRGDRVAFVGPNGVGKTTLLKMLTGEVAPDNWAARARDQLCGTAVDAEWRELYDSTQLNYRGARIIDGRLDAVIIIGPGYNLPPRDWLVALFKKQRLEPTERARLLRGTPPRGERDAGAIVCSCFSVGANTLTRAIREQRLQTPEEIGAALRAGTNCGSCVPELRRLIVDAMEAPGD